MVRVAKELNTGCYSPATDISDGQFNCIFCEVIRRQKVRVEFDFLLLVVKAHLNLIFVFKLSASHVQLYTDITTLEITSIASNALQIAIPAGYAATNYPLTRENTVLYIYMLSR